MKSESLRKEDCPIAIGLLNPGYPEINPPPNYSKLKGVPFTMQEGHFGKRRKRGGEQNEMDEQQQYQENLQQYYNNGGYSQIEEYNGGQEGSNGVSNNNSLDFSRGLGRDKVKSFLKVVNGEGRFARSYNPNYKSVEKRLDKLCLPFGKSVGRDFEIKMEDRSPYNEVLDQLVRNQGNRKSHKK